ncbi:MAG: peptide chain release factor N(5)-glutamine methyltransferase [Phycisphaerales bacterium]|nr:peptide chain release factor N(5)-glutamine methyltransferase [Phycisphaerales bacterium]
MNDKTIGYCYTDFWQSLLPLYEKQEAQNIAELVFDAVLLLPLLERIKYRSRLITTRELQLIEPIKKELLLNKPIQYILGKAWFCGMPLTVNPSTLIPRPETEELVHWICNDLANTTNHTDLLDIGTGSGCIALAIKKTMPNVRVTALDISEDALKIAQSNSEQLGLTIDFIKANILEIESLAHIPFFQYIVSNPPYIPYKDAKTMDTRVTHFEPSLALFVDDQYPLMFYDKILDFATTHLAESGRIFAEINEGLHEEVEALFKNTGCYKTSLKKDFQGKWRLIKAIKI